MRSAHVRFCLLVLALPGVAACQPSSPKLAGAGMDMFTPVKMRIHPLSRVAAPAASQVEARVELTDQFGDTGKGVGMLSFQLFAYQTVALGHKGDRLADWSMNLSTPADNRTFWDPITRTYFFKLPLPPGVLAKQNRVILEATLTLPNGEHFSDDITLSVK